MPTSTAPEGLKWFGADIVKVSPNTDGTCLVFGRVAGDTLDDDKQILDKGWLDVALPEWGERGNVRAMHQLISAGKMQSLTDNGASGWDLVSKIVDPTEVKKCLEGLYTGYSVGIKTPVIKADKMAENGRIVGGKVIEVSLADRPCDPTNKLALVDKVAALPTETEVADAVKATKKPEPKKDEDDDEDDESAADKKKGKKKMPWAKASLSDASRDILKLLIEHEANDPTSPYDAERLVGAYAALTKASFDEEVVEGDTLKLATAADEMLAAAIPNVEKMGSPIGVTQATTGAFAGMRNTLQDILDRNRRPKGDGPTAVDPESADPADSPKGEEGRKVSEIDQAIDRLLLKAAVIAEPVTKAASTEAPMSDILTKLDAVTKAVQPDALKAILSEATKPLEDRIAEMEKLAAPGGPMLGGQRTLSAPDVVKASIAAQRLTQFEAMLDSDDPRIAQGARQALTEAGYYNQ